MNTYIITFHGVFLQGYAVVKAKNRVLAAKSLMVKLREKKLEKDNDINKMAENAKKIDVDKQEAIIIWDGDY